ncbi:UNKNOWN [Stylonychia lemnae]|uniref:Uncharacterized protein n=1 Tax=Stylonychia lemnae TaxID=5949 RepID=A0A078ALR1_STYLE|nr:UNKNOWN [Stylonychia lemnae]|eukprot:CDW83290.1 UNKNOWN [Stylonychia lemnae]
MIKKYEVNPQLKVAINMEIPGLRKKKVAFAGKPNNRRFMASWISYERNGFLNVGLSRNWTRIAFPIVPVFFFVYMWNPIIHGTTYIQHYNNYQWEGIYFKYGSNRPVYTDQTITRLA